MHIQSFLQILEDSDINLSDSMSNDISTISSHLSSTMTNLKIIIYTKAGKIYKPKFHTALQYANNNIETSFLSFTSTNNFSSMTVIVVPKSNPEYQIQKHINKIITDNHIIIDTMDPRLHKLIQRQQSLVETKQIVDQPLNLSSAKKSLRKRCCSESFVQQCKVCPNESKHGSIIKNLLLKNQNSYQKSKAENENCYCSSFDVSHSSIDVLDIHRKYYRNSRRKYQLEIKKGESDLNSKSSYYYTNSQSLSSSDSLLCNTRLIDTYISPVKKHRSEFVPSTLQSFEELYINSLQMFGEEVKILNNTGENKTMRIETQSINSQTDEEIVNNKFITSETASIVVRSDFHSGDTMIYKPPIFTSSSFISLSNVPKILTPIIPIISTSNISNTIKSINLTKTKKSKTKLMKNSDVV